MANVEIITHKSNILHESIRKLNYYLVGLTIALLYILFQFSGSAVVSSDYNWAFVILWADGSVAFITGAMHLYLLTEFYGRDLGAVNRWESFKDLMQAIRNEKPPFHVAVVAKAVSEDNDISQSHYAWKNAADSRDKFWPKSTLALIKKHKFKCFREGIFWTSLNYLVYQISMGSFIVGALVMGGFIVEARLNNGVSGVDEQLLQIGVHAVQSDATKDPVVSTEAAAKDLKPTSDAPKPSLGGELSEAPPSSAPESNPVQKPRSSQ